MSAGCFNRDGPAPREPQQAKAHDERIGRRARCGIEGHGRRSKAECMRIGQ
jgi:hypothetical protein